jgi:hypothetical protein
MKYTPRKRTDEHKEYIESRMKESREMHQRNVEVHNQVAEEIRRDREKNLIHAAKTYNPGIFVWLLVVGCAYFFLS